MWSLEEFVNYIVWYVREGSLGKLLLKIATAFLFIGGGLLLLYVCVVYRILRALFKTKND